MQWGIFKIPVEVSHVIAKNVDTITIKMIELTDGYIILKLSSNGINLTGKAWKFKKVCVKRYV